MPWHHDIGRRNVQSGCLLGRMRLFTFLKMNFVLLVLTEGNTDLFLSVEFNQ